MQTTRIRILAEIGLAMALFAVLSQVKIPLPFNLFGGSINLAMLPIVILALLRGPIVGIACGLLCGVLDLLFGAYIVHPAQAFLDYLAAYGMVGLSGMLHPLMKQASHATGPTTAKVAAIAVMGTLLGAAARFIPALVSGAVFFGEYAPQGQPIWLYSLLYNLTYLVPSAVAVAAIAALVLPILARTLDR